MRDLSIYDKPRMHKGIDFEANIGDPVFSVADGTVLLIDRVGKGSAGKRISIQHSDGSVTKFFHGDSIPENLDKWDAVKAGQQIMKAGQSGAVTGPHVHFEVHKLNDKGKLVAVDPLEEMPDVFADFVFQKTGKTVSETKQAGF